MSIMYKSRGGTGKVAVKMNAMNEECIRLAEGNKKLMDILVVAKDHWLVAKEQWVNSENANNDEVAYLKLLVTSLKEQVREKNEQWDKLKILNDKKVTHIKDLSDENKKLSGQWEKHNLQINKLKEVIEKFRMLPPGQSMLEPSDSPCFLCKQENEKLKGLLENNPFINESLRENEKLKKENNELKKEIISQSEHQLDINVKLKKEIDEMKTFIHGYKQNLVNNNSITGP